MFIREEGPMRVLMDLEWRFPDNKIDGALSESYADNQGRKPSVVRR